MTDRAALQRTGRGGALQIKPADWKDNGHPLVPVVPVSFSAFTRPQSRSWFQADVPA